VYDKLPSTTTPYCHQMSTIRVYNKLHPPPPLIVTRCTICQETEIQFVYKVSVCQLDQFHGLGWGVREQLSGPLPPEINASH